MTDEDLGIVDVLIEEPLWKEALPGLADLAADVARRGIAAIGHDPEGMQFCLLATNDGVIATLNRDHRGKASPTNVLSWPAFDLAPEEDGAAPAPPPAGNADEGRIFIGDVALALQIVKAEAEAAGRPLKDHAIHLILHGVLHLLGHDHGRHRDAARMEGIEREVLMALGLPDPYLEADVAPPHPDE